VDLVPFKTCSYDCIYCQLGRTTCRTVERKEWVPVEELLNELATRLASGPDYITLSGSGEPTLHARLGELIERIQTMTKVPVAVLTNGSLLWQKQVRDEVARADVVMPSLDAPDHGRFAFINRPHREVTFERMLEGLGALRHECKGKYWLEVMLLGGYTALPAAVEQLAEWVRRIQPDKVQLNTAVRPPVEDYAMAVPSDRLAALANLFTPPAEVIAEYRGRQGRAEPQGSAQAVLTMLQRRPCTLDDVARGLSLRHAEVVKLLAVLEADGRVSGNRRGDPRFYQVTSRESLNDT
jgi:wyosine [tRNA(Phe)-imidazoG37] synthetase (radical SAM superfamily)